MRTQTVEQITEAIIADKKAKTVVFDGENARDAAIAIDVAKSLEDNYGQRVLYQVGTTMAALLSGRPASASEMLTVDAIKKAFPNLRWPGLTIVGSLTNRTRTQVFHLRMASAHNGEIVADDTFNDESLDSPKSRNEELHSTC